MNPWTFAAFGDELAKLAEESVVVEPEPKKSLGRRVGGSIAGYAASMVPLSAHAPVAKRIIGIPGVREAVTDEQMHQLADVMKVPRTHIVEQGSLGLHVPSKSRTTWFDQHQLDRAKVNNHITDDIIISPRNSTLAHEFGHGANLAAGRWRALPRKLTAPGRILAGSTIAAASVASADDSKADIIAPAVAAAGMVPGLVDEAMATRAGARGLKAINASQSMQAEYKHRMRRGFGTYMAQAAAFTAAPIAARWVKKRVVNGKPPKDGVVKKAQLYPEDMAKGTKKPKKTPRPGAQGLLRPGAGKPAGGGSATPFSGNKTKIASMEKWALSDALRFRAAAKAHADIEALRGAADGALDPLASFGFESARGRREGQWETFTGKKRKDSSWVKDTSGRVAKKTIDPLREVPEWAELHRTARTLPLNYPKKPVATPAPTPAIDLAPPHITTKPGPFRPRNLAIGAGVATVGGIGLLARHNHIVNKRNEALKAKKEELEKAREPQKAASFEKEALLQSTIDSAREKARASAEELIHSKAKQANPTVHEGFNLAIGRRVRQFHSFGGKLPAGQEVQPEFRTAGHAKGTKGIEDLVAKKRPGTLTWKQHVAKRISADNPSFLARNRGKIGVGATAVIGAGAIGLARRRQANKEPPTTPPVEEAKAASHPDLDTILGAAAITGTGFAAKKLVQQGIPEDAHETAKRKALQLHGVRGVNSVLRARLG